MEDFNKYTSHINYSPIVDFVLQQGKQTYYKKGDYFSRQGEVCKTMGFVSSGSFRYCCTNSVGENSIVGYTFDHSFVGNYPAFQLQDKSNVDIQALCDCSVYVINYQQVGEPSGTAIRRTAAEGGDRKSAGDEACDPAVR